MMETMKNGISNNSRKIASLESENIEMKIKYKKMEKENKEVKKQLSDLKAVVCSMKPDASICK
jgi:hypothetical protein